MEVSVVDESEFKDVDELLLVGFSQLWLLDPRRVAEVNGAKEVKLEANGSKRAARRNFDLAERTKRLGIFRVLSR